MNCRSSRVITPNTPERSYPTVRLVCPDIYNMIVKDFFRESELANKINKLESGIYNLKYTESCEYNATYDVVDARIYKLVVASYQYRAVVIIADDILNNAIDLIKSFGIDACKTSYNTIDVNFMNDITLNEINKNLWNCHRLMLGRL